MTCPAFLCLSAEAWGFKKEYELPCKLPEGHKGSHTPILPSNIHLSGEGAWAIRVRFKKWPRP